jgi:hypothetical protein
VLLVVSVFGGLAGGRRRACVSGGSVGVGCRRCFLVVWRASLGQCVCVAGLGDSQCFLAVWRGLVGVVGSRCFWRLGGRASLGQCRWVAGVGFGLCLVSLFGVLALSVCLLVWLSVVGFLAASLGQCVGLC